MEVLPIENDLWRFYRLRGDVNGGLQKGTAKPGAVVTRGLKSRRRSVRVSASRAYGASGPLRIAGSTHRAATGSNSS